MVHVNVQVCHVFYDVSPSDNTANLFLTSRSTQQLPIFTFLPNHIFDATHFRYV